MSVLNRLLQTLCRSLALYVEEIKPWSLAGHEPVWTAIGRLAADSRMYSQRVAEAIIEHGGQPNPGPYPLKFAALNDVGLEFFLREIIVHLKRDQKVIGECAAELAACPRGPLAGRRGLRQSSRTHRIAGRRGGGVEGPVLPKGTHGRTLQQSMVLARPSHDSPVPA